MPASQANFTFSTSWRGCKRQPLFIFMEAPMKITENENKEIVQMVREGLKKTGGYCPCRMQRTPENKCMCEEFRRQIADPDFEGYCHCMLYYKSKD